MGEYTPPSCQTCFLGDPNIRSEASCGLQGRPQTHTLVGRADVKSLPVTDSVAFIHTHCFVLHTPLGPLQLPAPVFGCVKHYGTVPGVSSCAMHSSCVGKQKQSFQQFGTLGMMDYATDNLERKGPMDNISPSHTRISICSLWNTTTSSIWTLGRNADVFIYLDSVSLCGQAGLELTAIHLFLPPEC